MLQIGRFPSADKHKHENGVGRIGDWMHDHSGFRIELLLKVEEKFSGS
jgi:hypothetical protein